MREKQIIVCDIDDVLSKFNESWIELYNKKANDDLCIEQITEWKIINFVKEEWKSKIFTDEIIYSPNFYFNVPLKEYAKEFVEWTDQYFDLLLVSAPLFENKFNNTTLSDKAEWIKVNFPNYDIRKFIPCYFKSYLKSYIRMDDRPKNFVGEAEHKILLDRPWNHDDCEENEYIKNFGLIRKNNLLEVKDYLQNLL